VLYYTSKLPRLNIFFITNLDLLQRSDIKPDLLQKGCKIRTKFSADVELLKVLQVTLLLGAVETSLSLLFWKSPFFASGSETFVVVGYKHMVRLITIRP
jgi:hypothetical protein